VLDTYLQKKDRYDRGGENGKHLICMEEKEVFMPYKMFVKKGTEEKFVELWKNPCFRSRDTERSEISKRRR
jgi:hypothetical protein